MTLIAFTGLFIEILWYVLFLVAGVLLVRNIELIQYFQSNTLESNPTDEDDEFQDDVSNLGFWEGIGTTFNQAYNSLFESTESKNSKANSPINVLLVVAGKILIAYGVISILVKIITFFIILSDSGRHINF